VPVPGMRMGVGVPIAPVSALATSVTIFVGVAGAHANSVRVTRGIPHGHTNGPALPDPTGGKGHAIIGPPTTSIATATALMETAEPSMFTEMVVARGDWPSTPAAP